MQITAPQASILYKAMRLCVQNGQEVPKRFPDEKQIDAMMVAKKTKHLMKAIDENRVQFLGGECELSTEEKALVLECLKREWTIDELEAKEELKALLS